MKETADISALEESDDFQKQLLEAAQGIVKRNALIMQFLRDSIADHKEVLAVLREINVSLGGSPVSAAASFNSYPISMLAKLLPCVNLDGPSTPGVESGGSTPLGSNGTSGDTSFKGNNSSPYGPPTINWSQPPKEYDPSIFGPPTIKWSEPLTFYPPEIFFPPTLSGPEGSMRVTLVSADGEEMSSPLPPASGPDNLNGCQSQTAPETVSSPSGSGGSSAEEESARDEDQDVPAAEQEAEEGTSTVVEISLPAARDAARDNAFQQIMATLPPDQWVDGCRQWLLSGGVEPTNNDIDALANVATLADAARPPTQHGHKVGSPEWFAALKAPPRPSTESRYESAVAELPVGATTSDQMQDAWYWSHFAANYGPPLTSKLISHWLEGTGQPYQIEPADLARLESTPKIQDAEPLLESRFIADAYRNAFLLPGQSIPVDITESIASVTFEKPTEFGVYTTEGDMYSSFHDVDTFSARYVGIVFADGAGNLVFNGDIEYSVTDKYEFQPRDWHPIPSSPVTDYDFWLLQQHGVTQGFTSTGTWQKKNVTVIIANPQMTTPKWGSNGTY